MEEKKQVRQIKQNEPLYFIVNLICKRAKQLSLQNAAPQVNLPSYTNPLYVAAEEIKQNKILVRPRKFKYKVVDLIH